MFLLSCGLADNYQGEEADVIIVTLVRSNIENKIGFLGEPERVNVMLSRARHGMILIGNSETLLRCSSERGRVLWEEKMRLLKAANHFYSGLPIVCQRHAASTALVTTPADFNSLAPEGAIFIFFVTHLN